VLLGQPVTRKARRSLTANVASRFWISLRRSAGLSLFSKYFVEHLLVERQIRHQLFQPAVLVLELPELLDLARRHLAEPFLPPVPGLLADPKLPTDLHHRGAVIHLLQGQGDLLVRKSALPHGLILSS